MTTTQEKNKIDRPATPEDPIYYRVTKATAMGNPGNYDLTWKDTSRLARYKANAAWCSFDTREEAVAHAEGRGWTKVSTWKEAEELAQPAIKTIAAERAKRAEEADRRTFVTEDQIVDLVESLAPGGEHLKVWVGKDGQLRARKAQGY